MDNAFQEVIFWSLAALSAGAALLVVHVRNMFHAALLLVASFLGVAGLFAQMNAEFLAVVQVLIYAGGIAVLVVFAVMLTRDVPEGNRNTPVQPVAAAVGVVLLGALIYTIVQAQWNLLPDDLPGPLQAVLADTPAELGQMLLSDFVLAFEITGVLLLAAVVGALALVRER